MRLLIRNTAVAIFRFFGSDVIDQRTGNRVGRAFLFGWRGRVIVIGLDNEPPLQPVFLPQKRLTYWKQEIGFASHPHPDFPSEPLSVLRSPMGLEPVETAVSGLPLDSSSEALSGLRSPVSGLPHDSPPSPDAPAAS